MRALEQWDGNGAVRVLVRDGNAIVLERAGQTLRCVGDRRRLRSLRCCATQLTVSTPTAPETSMASQLFKPGSPRCSVTQYPGSITVRVIADRILEHSTLPVLLHGDMHHENVSTVGERLVGHRSEGDPRSAESSTTATSSPLDAAGGYRALRRTAGSRRESCIHRPDRPPALDRVLVCAVGHLAS